MDNHFIKTKKMWTIEQIEKHGFKLISNEKLWCHFRGNDFDVLINLDTRFTDGDLFNFKSYKNAYKGNFKAKLSNDEQMKTILRVIK